MNFCRLCFCWLSPPAPDSRPPLPICQACHGELRSMPPPERFPLALELAKQLDAEQRTELLLRLSITLDNAVEEARAE